MTLEMNYGIDDQKKKILLMVMMKKKSLIQSLPKGER
jgi:hypothetical protein